MNFYKEYLSEKSNENNKKPLNKISYEIVDNFTQEMNDFIQMVAGRKLNFLENYFKDNVNNVGNKKQITIRVDGMIVAYSRIEHDEMLLKYSDYEINCPNDIFVGRGCVHPKFRGMLLYYTLTLVSYRYAIINKCPTMSCFMNVKNQRLIERLDKFNFKQISDKLKKLPYAWDNYESLADFAFFQFKLPNHSFNNQEFLNNLDKLIEYSLKNEKDKFNAQLSIVYKSKL